MASSRAFEDDSGPLRPFPFLRERRIMCFPSAFRRANCREEFPDLWSGDAGTLEESGTSWRVEIPNSANLPAWPGHLDEIPLDGPGRHDDRID